ncbi:MULTISPECIES: hypothetical protein [Tenacibaculum]|uniref:hypothetical protein n=1 Tax=Tenacibaculum TaxID=104267 RepID=UPI000A72268A|nr:hypothetical protein [Tenacibaculum mesophilum]BFF37938.1 hypothetical protein BACT7_28000 [Tenacibaculum mesophilum]BFF41343.1 hypothetical protein BACY1_31480 [Tenacibaculum mesophilum]
MKELKELSFKEKLEINGGLQEDYDWGYSVGVHIRQGVETVLSWWDKIKSIGD